MWKIEVSGSPALTSNPSLCLAPLMALLPLPNFPWDGMSSQAFWCSSLLRTSSRSSSADWNDDWPMLGGSCVSFLPKTKNKALCVG
ncbi:hypothetical protein M438DRAFT_344897 [Aureobasidium pullulans EXF-150]|uniref:Uncharacterized protein n=1 Tax=Aureobasidium pullulans EXF-150 TaxID=1043002 RepID=A0A074XPQ5_AURPU|nr:uncharacterized protein M438DRAFT_344897 [Aureobasidium pullulans EXF-150]KEQ85609.1 hypothetical protein M438DRAFT_344897 [Aureobasidium pullulans EXF-150]